MLVEGNDRLIVPVFENPEPGAIETVNQNAVIANHYVHQNEVCAGVNQRGCGGRLRDRLRRGWRLCCRSWSCLRPAGRGDEDQY